MLNVGLIQTTIDQDPHKNFELFAKKIAVLAKQGTKLIVLPELHNHPYFCQTMETTFFDLAESIQGTTINNMIHLAKQHNVVLVVPFFEKRAEGVYHNTVIVIDTDGSIAGKYRKMHIPDDPGYHEKYYFTPGDQGFIPIQTSVGCLGILICWDQWFPEAARAMALAGAQCLIYPTAIGWDPQDTDAEKQRQRDAWQIIQRSHAIANHIPVISCNRIGFEAHPHDPKQGIQFWGHSFICGGQGEILVDATNSEQEWVTTLDFDRTRTLRRIWPYFRDRRIEYYQPLLQRFNLGNL
jgi:N-carbamoylputrescine amidase